MPNTATLQVRLPENDLAYLKTFADSQGANLSNLIRITLEPTIVSAKIANLAKSYDYIKRIVLFGSMARGEQSDDSDIDIAIEFSKPTSWMGEHGLGDFIRRSSDLTKRSIDYVSFDSCNPKITKEIMRDGKLIYEK